MPIESFCAPLCMFYFQQLQTCFPYQNCTQLGIKTEWLRSCGFRGRWLHFPAQIGCGFVIDGILASVCQASPKCRDCGQALLCLWCQSGESGAEKSYFSSENVSRWYSLVLFSVAVCFVCLLIAPKGFGISLGHFSYRSYRTEDWFLTPSKAKAFTGLRILLPPARRWAGWNCCKIVDNEGWAHKRCRIQAEVSKRSLGGCSAWVWREQIRRIARACEWRGKKAYGHWKMWVHAWGCCEQNSVVGEKPEASQGVLLPCVANVCEHPCLWRLLSFGSSRGWQAEECKPKGQEEQAYQNTYHKVAELRKSLHTKSGTDLRGQCSVGSSCQSRLWNPSLE